MTRYINHHDKAFETMTSDELYLAIQAIRSVLASRRRPAIYKSLSKWQWEQERAEMRLQLALLTELLELRGHIAQEAEMEAAIEAGMRSLLSAVPAHLAPLPDSRNGFDSDLCSPQELQMLAARQKTKADGSKEPDRPTLLLLTTICNMRRALKSAPAEQVAGEQDGRVAA